MRKNHVLLLFLILYLFFPIPKVKVYAHPAIPTFVAVGAKAGGTGTVTPALPSGIQINDILLLFAESNTGQTVTIQNPNGGTWTEVSDSPQNSAASRLTIFWSRYNGVQGNPTTNDPGDHICAAIAAWRGVITSGNPWDVTSGGVEDTSDTSLSATGDTTTVADCLIIIVSSTGTDGTAAQFSTWVNSGLSDVTERVDYCVNSGGGGGFGVAEGGKTNAGSYGATTATLATASTKGFMTIALKPPTISEYSRSASQSMLLITGTTKVFSTTKTASKTMVISLNGNRLLDLNRGISRQITFSLSSSKVIEFFKGVSQQLTLFISSSKTLEFLKVVSQSISFVSDVTRIREIIKNVSVLITTSIQSTVNMIANRITSVTISFTNSAIGSIGKLYEVVTNLGLLIRGWGTDDNIGIMGSNPGAKSFLNILLFPITIFILLALALWRRR